MFEEKIWEFERIILCCGEERGVRRTEREHIGETVRELVGGQGEFAALGLAVEEVGGEQRCAQKVVQAFDGRVTGRDMVRSKVCVGVYFLM